MSGIFVPVVTPFDHRGEVYPTKLKFNIERLNAINLTGYVVGSEHELLAADEKLHVWELAAGAAKPGKLLGAVSTAGSVRETIYLTNQAAGLGYHFAVISGSPLYRQAVADGAKIPVVLPNLTHDALNLFPAFKTGSVGGIIAVANAIPYSVQLIWEAYRQREDEAGLDWQARIAPLATLIEKHGVPALKWAMDLNGYYGGVPRLPQVPVTDAVKAEIAAAMIEIRS